MTGVSVTPRLIYGGAVLVALVSAALLAVTWVGFIESDDLEYARSAALWLDAFPHLGQSHWGLRHLIVLPVAASFAVFGRGEVALVLPTILYAAGIIAMTGFCVRRIAGSLAGVLAALLVATLPVFATGASIVYSDIPEAFFVLASLWAYYFATQSRNATLFLLSGIFAGCAFITRETTIALLALYLVLFLAAPRRILDFVSMAAGCLLIIGLDFAWLWAASGDPLWRMHISQRGVAGDNPTLAHFIVNSGGLDRHGVIVAPRAIQALLAIFVNQSMGLLAWAAVPAAIALARRPRQEPSAAAGTMFAGLALVWFLVLSYAFLFMWIVPRYQTVTMVALCVPLAIWLAGRIAAGARAPSQRLSCWPCSAPAPPCPWSPTANCSSANAASSPSPASARARSVPTPPRCVVRTGCWRSPACAPRSQPAPASRMPYATSTRARAAPCQPIGPARTSRPAPPSCSRYPGNPLSWARFWSASASSPSCPPASAPSWTPRRWSPWGSACPDPWPAIAATRTSSPSPQSIAAPARCPRPDC